MFNQKKRIKNLEERINKLEERQAEFLKHANEVMSTVIKQGKKNYMWQLREEEIELMEEGRKVRKIRKILS